MSPEAIAMMVVAMVFLWGGLGLAVLNLVRRDRRETRDDRPAA